MHRILRREPRQPAAVKVHGKELIIEGIGAIRHIVCHKVNAPGRLVHLYQLLHDHFPARRVK